jgi:seryl-tRNA synthetase
MLDINFIRENPEVVKKACKNKNVNISVDLVLTLDKEKRELMTEIETLKAEQNKISRGGAENQAIFAQAKEIKNKIKEIEPRLEKIDVELKDLLLQLPNIPLEDVPTGSSEDENKVIKTVGKKPNFGFAPKNHWQLAESLNLIDKDRAAKVSGTRFAYLKGQLVLLELAMFRFAFDALTNKKILSEIVRKAKLKVSTKPFVPVLPPFMIRTEPYMAMDRLEPQEERYKIEGEDLWLEGSAEHVLGTMHMNETLPENIFPIRYAGYATSFRKEAGTYGKDMEGILRMHQFNKLEMESLTTAENSLSEHHFLIAIQEYLMQQLGLPYEVILKCTADIGKPNARGVDINVWLPGQNKYRETHTADYMTDYQARRLQTRVRRKSGKVELVHTNDATALAERPLIAILENYQQKDGSIKVPKALQKYAGFKVIKL